MRFLVDNRAHGSHAGTDAERESDIDGRKRRTTSIDKPIRFLDADGLDVSEDAAILNDAEAVTRGFRRAPGGLFANRTRQRSFEGHS